MSALAALLTTMSTPPKRSTVASTSAARPVEIAHVGRHTQRFPTHPDEVRLGLGARVGLAARHHHLGAGAHEAFGE